MSPLVRRAAQVVLVVAVPFAIAGGYVAWKHWKRRTVDINVVGGTVLVYEPEQPGAIDPDLASRVGAVIRARALLPHVSARPGAGGQVEVLVPRGGKEAHEWGHRITTSKFEPLVLNPTWWHRVG